MEILLSTNNIGKSVTLNNDLKAMGDLESFISVLNYRSSFSLNILYGMDLVVWAISVTEKDYWYIKPSYFLNTKGIK